MVDAGCLHSGELDERDTLKWEAKPEDGISSRADSIEELKGLRSNSIVQSYAADGWQARTAPFTHSQWHWLGLEIAAWSSYQRVLAGIDSGSLGSNQVPEHRRCLK